MVRLITSYTVTCHNALTGGIDRMVYQTLPTAKAAAASYHRTGEYLWIDVIRRDRAGRVACVHHIERAPTPAERASIVTRYAA